MAIVIAVALIAFAIYVFRVKKRLVVYSNDFAKAIDEFNSLCNPGRPMTGEEWEQFASSHSLDFGHANEATGSKFIAWVVKDLANANKLVDIQNNHQAYIDGAKSKYDNIAYVNYYLAGVIQAQQKLFDGKHYVAKSEVDGFLITNKQVIDAVRFCVDNGVKDYLTQAQDALKFNKFIKEIEQNRASHNNAFVKSELQRCGEFFDNVLAYPLDPQQRNAIINGEDNCLVVSSAGSGKTSTIQGKVRYLIDMCKVDPNDILLITYTRKAAGELRERIGYSDLTSSTFHGLAYNIISQVDKAPSIATADFSLNLFYELLNY